MAFLPSQLVESADWVSIVTETDHRAIVDDRHNFHPRDWSNRLVDAVAGTNQAIADQGPFDGSDIDVYAKTERSIGIGTRLTAFLVHFESPSKTEIIKANIFF